MTAEVYDLNLFRERIKPSRKLRKLAFVEREIRQIGRGRYNQALEHTGLPGYARSLTEWLLALPEHNHGTPESEWHLITELKRIDRLRQHDTVAYFTQYVLWIDSLLDHFGYGSAAYGA